MKQATNATNEPNEDHWEFDQIMQAQHRATWIWLDHIFRRKKPEGTLEEAEQHLESGWRRLRKLVSRCSDRALQHDVERDYRSFQRQPLLSSKRADEEDPFLVWGQRLAQHAVELESVGLDPAGSAPSLYELKITGKQLRRGAHGYYEVELNGKPHGFPLREVEALSVAFKGYSPNKDGFSMLRKRLVRLGFPRDLNQIQVQGLAQFNK